MKPVVDRLQQEYAGRIEFHVYGDVNGDATANKLAAQKGVSAIPTMVLVAPDGTEITRFVGSRPESDLKKRLDAELAQAH